MVALKWTVAGPLLALAMPLEAQGAGDRVAQWRPIVVEASTRFSVPVDWIERVIRAETGGRTMLGGKPIRSRAGAIGLMQLMPATWAIMRAGYRLGADPDNPHDNIIAGSGYLRLMYARFGYPGLFAAYNAGPGRYAAYLAGRSPLPAETVAYLGSVTGRRPLATDTASTPPHQLLFALRRDLADDHRPASDTVANDNMFAIRKGQP